MNTSAPARIRAVELLGGHEVVLTFTNGERRRVDLGPLLRGPVFERIRDDPTEFRRVYVDPQFGTIVWPNGADLCPDVLYHGGPPPWAEGATTRDGRAES